MSTYKPLAETLRPVDLSDFIGQQHLLDSDKPIGKAIKDNQLHSMILWGPSGVGKTTLARIICSQMGAHFEQMSAVFDGVKELRDIIRHAELYKQHNKSTILFVDEVHRFNKAQQDGFLPHIESGLLTLIGATTENPSFEINSALLSRARVYVLKKLSNEELEVIALRAMKSQQISLEDDGSLNLVIENSDGDARRLINIIEQLANSSGKALIKTDVVKTLQKKLGSFDKGGDIFYQQLSACLLYTSPSPRDRSLSRMPSSA